MNGGASVATRRGLRCFAEKSRRVDAWRQLDLQPRGGRFGIAKDLQRPVGDDERLEQAGLLVGLVGGRR